jgi:hypothetical protein
MTGKKIIFPLRYYANCVSTTLTVFIKLKVSISFRVTLYIIIIIISSSSSSSSIQPFGPVWQEPEPNQATGMALVRCVPGKFIGVGCHYFPLPIYILTFAARCSHVPNNASAPSSERWKYRARNGRLILPITYDFHGKL